MSSPRLGDHGLRQILSDVVEEVKHSIKKEINGAELLHSLLNTPWLKSLLKVYERLQQHQREPPAPFLPYTTQLIQQILADMRTVPDPSAEARELYSLLRGPHFQALISAHDTVAQKDYDPVLPPIPDNLPDDEEAMRIVCLVKNKQQLRSSGGGIRSRWDSLSEMTRRRLIHGGARGGGGPPGMVWGALGAEVPGEQPVMPSTRESQLPTS
ncbi:MAGUK p55 subfamily member 4-like [Coregonus clupeaformis]|uniref:MAGUK p55 subfamily member 4-like n=1 Tax=Coregonus clupeaformis TaxID=59861 RepID=UPI001E1C421F|nr:MAGUK p55 subfamily member 4-like [Coregonus clupeaformis]